MTASNAFIINYWGKAHPNTTNTPQWHPLAYHSLDVAASLDAYLNARPAITELLASLTKLPVTEARKRILIVAALHDIGKFADNFQIKVPDLYAAMGKKWESLIDSSGHGVVGQGIWQKICEEAFTQLDDWLFASFSHHGTPISECLYLTNICSMSSIMDAKCFMHKVFELFGTPSDDFAENGHNNNQKWLVTGLIIIADWIGSNTKWFPYCAPEKSIEKYWDYAKTQANIAIEEAQIKDCDIAGNFNLKDLLDVAAIPSPLQEWAQNQTPNNEPNLYIIEDLTGAGKTEAVMILAHRIMKAGAAEGVYWALPSMASSNSLYDRISKTYHKLFKDGDPSLVLAHSARDINDAFQLSIKEFEPANYPNQNSDQEISAEAACASFIADDRKKTFLAQFGIGTIDQALLGVLPVRHQALRLLGLARRVLVIDEAHSYDSYMNKGLERLLEFQRALGGSAIILSATLTKAQKNNFLRAYHGSGSHPTKYGVQSDEFPLITQISPQTKANEAAIPAQNGTRRDLKINRIESADDALQQLLQHAQNGAACVYIRNSVKEALAAYEYLKTRHDKVQLFHSRFTIGDRSEIEKGILKRFGKNSKIEERFGQVIVSTQVIEQSLDLDFDIMFTDLAPIDLLIQRAGRLQRHKRPEIRPTPILNVVSHSAENDISEDWYSSLFPTGQFVYPHHGELWKSMKVLQDLDGINLSSGSPRDLIEPVFNANTNYPSILDKKSEKVEGERQAKRGIANMNFLDFQNGFTPQNTNWAKDVVTPTRLSEPSLTVQLAIWINGALVPMVEMGDRSWRYSEIQIRAAQFRESILPAPEVQAAIDKKNANWHRKYDPPILLIVEPTEIDGVYKGQIKDQKDTIHEVTYSKTMGLQIGQ